MKHSTKAPTQAEAKRMALIKQGFCLACEKRQILTPNPEVHHLLSGGKRMGHHYTIGLCRWHHQGNTMGMRHPQGGDLDEATATYLLGPSMAKQPRSFRQEFGTDWELLEMQNMRIGLPPPAPFDRKQQKQRRQKRMGSSKILTHTGKF